MERLLVELTRLCLWFTLRLTLALLNCALRLFTWSVCRYGWSRTCGAIAALVTCLWAYTALRGWTWNPEMALAVGGGAWVLFAAGPRAALLGRRLVLSGARRALAHRQLRWIAACRLLAGAPAAPLWLGTPAAIPGSDAAAPPLPGALWPVLTREDTLHLAWQRVAARRGAPGSDGISIETFTLEYHRQLQALQRQLEDGSYRCLPPRWVAIPKASGGERRLAILAVRDRVVHQALHHTLCPLWDQRFTPASFAYRPGHSVLHAVEAVDRALAGGRVWAVRADIASFFDRVRHDRLLALLESWLPDARARWLLARCLAVCSPAPGVGIAQGAATSPLLANLFLHDFDDALLRAGHSLVRYADDFLLLCPTRPHAEAALHSAEQLLRAMGLSLHPAKTHIVHRDDGFAFLGYRFSAAGRSPAAAAPAPAAAGASLSLAISPAVYGAAPGPAPVAPPPPHGPSALESTTVSAAGSALLVRPAASFEPAEADLDLFRARFLGRGDVFGRYWRRERREGYVPVRRAPSNADLAAHLAGAVVLGTYLLTPPAITRALVFDVDGPSMDETGRHHAQALAQQLHRAMGGRGVEPLVVDSAGKGCHLWLCFAAPVRTDRARRWAHSFLDAFRPFPAGTLVEVFPKQDYLAEGALGALLRLPLGRHPHTGLSSHFLDGAGRPIVDPWAWLQAQPLVDPTVLVLDAAPVGGATQSSPQVDNAAAPDPAAPAVSLPEPPAPLAPMVRGCAMLWALVHKAAQARHLRHTERLVLLYTIGHCAEAGPAYIHQVVERCANYDPRETDRWLLRLELGHRPISCARLREWLRDYLPGVSCAGCATNTEGRGSPLGLLRRSGPGRAGTAAAPAALARSRTAERPDAGAAGAAAAAGDRAGQTALDAAWDLVAQDLFDAPPVRS